jgi:hypothetical protein
MGTLSISANPSYQLQNTLERISKSSLTSRQRNSAYAFGKLTCGRLPVPAIMVKANIGGHSPAPPQYTGTYGGFGQRLQVSQDRLGSKEKSANLLRSAPYSCCPANEPG